ncbi:NAD-dependent deacylase [Neolewinella lacunae]|uniref:NAD-dependent protein deacylase n=1 Tax=Neolewinella lacunae TaxID=1517758 RepID=A0A923PJW6_9BACT|nr:NAD-dependent deacylase [Neolewinella lacunae]MBC6992659.1 NAD-dependent deacylase [Neolewinella lacunae]MDN3633539.1 NAD-dependent deacylase [Neolewinella lacunae]
MSAKPLRERKKIVVLTGAGVSAESGIPTFRASDGLWENHRVEDVASPQGFYRDPSLVLNFYNLRRAQLLTVQPNRGHQLLAALEKDYDVHIVTQNIDDLHERAGSTNIIHLHGELKKVRPVNADWPILPWTGDLNLGDTDDKGNQLRPHIVWFGEEVPEIPRAAQTVAAADLLLIIGTSMQVYPAAGLVDYAPADAPIIYIDPRPTISHELRRRRNIHLLEMGGSAGMEVVMQRMNEWLPPG